MLCCKFPPNLCTVSRDVTVFVTTLGVYRTVYYESQQIINLLNAKGVYYRHIDLALLDKKQLHNLQELYPEIKTQLPLVYIDGDCFGGYTKVQEFIDNDELDEVIYNDVEIEDSHENCVLCIYD